MAAEEKVSRSRLRTSYISTVISISLVLFMLGLVGLILLHAKKLSDHVKENIGVTIFLHDDIKDADVRKLQKSLDAKHFVKSTAYIDKQQAAEGLKEELGEDFIQFLGYNPLLSSIDVHLVADFAHPDSIAYLEEDLMAQEHVKEVYYQKNLVILINDNVEKITFVLLGFSGLLLVIAIALINSSIRLSIYSKRFLIRSMQLVGATQRFIRRPFVFRGIGHGIISAFIAIGLLVGLIYSAHREFPDLFDFRDAEIFASLFGIVIGLGILISWISTSLAVRKYLRMKPQNLH